MTTNQALLEAQRAAERWAECDDAKREDRLRFSCIMWATLSIAESLADLTAAEFAANEAEHD
jgi:hypothetical protein